MKIVHPLLIGLAISAFLPAAAFSQRSSVRVGHDVTQSKTYTFQIPDDDERSNDTSTYDSQLITDRTTAAVAAELERRGLRRDDQDPDVYVTTRRAFRTEYIAHPTSGWGYAYPYVWPDGYSYGFGGSYYLDDIIRGTLIIDVHDALTGQLLWRGTGEKTVHRTSSPEHRLKRINREVTKIFENFPPSAVSGDR